jgi:ABC transporter substrate binding protein
LTVLSDPAMVARRAEIIELATRHRLPAIYALREWVEEGGLISYATNLSDQWRRAARYVDKILKGSRPSNLPIEQPAAFELWINVRAARAMRLTIPKSLLQRADKVIGPASRSLLPWVRVALLIRSIRATTFDEPTWPTAKTVLARLLSMRSQLARDGWWN